MRCSIYVVMVWSLLFYSSSPAQVPVSRDSAALTNSVLNIQKQTPIGITIDTVVNMGYYFTFMDSVVAQINRWGWSKLNEYLLVRFNPWLLDSLVATDYYLLKEKGIVCDDPALLTIFRPGDRIYLPDAASIDSMRALFGQTWLDLNIPEFKIRIMVGDTPRFIFPVRVGLDEQKYLAIAGRIVDLRTQIGRGRIVSVNRHPEYINPVDNKKYFLTHRDDNRLTKLPQIPFLEPEINGIRWGQMIHPTTNPATLGRAYSNGCIGVSEQAAWYLYYYAPVGTRIQIRYDREIMTPLGDTLFLPDIYPSQPNKESRTSVQSIPLPNHGPCCTILMPLLFVTLRTWQLW